MKQAEFTVPTRAVAIELRPKQVGKAIWWQVGLTSTAGFFLPIGDHCRERDEAKKLVSQVHSLLGVPGDEVILTCEDSLVDVFVKAWINEFDRKLLDRLRNKP